LSGFARGQIHDFSSFPDEDYLVNVAYLCSIQELKPYKTLGVVHDQALLRFFTISGQKILLMMPCTFFTDG